MPEMFPQVQMNDLYENYKIKQDTLGEASHVVHYIFNQKMALRNYSNVQFLYMKIHIKTVAVFWKNDTCFCLT